MAGTSACPAGGSWGGSDARIMASRAPDATTRVTMQTAGARRRTSRLCPRPRHNEGHVDTAERYEQLIAYLSSRLPEPVEQHEHADGSLQFIAGDPAEVVVLLTDTSVIVSEFAAV